MRKLSTIDLGVEESFKLLVPPEKASAGQSLSCLNDKSPIDRAKSLHYVGKIAVDDPSYWNALVYDCTLFNTELGQRSIPQEGFSTAEFIQIRQEKAVQMLDIPIQEWFEPIFKAIDQGVIDGHKVLVHCQAGQSRSATILAAYLINRFKVTSAQAINFLKSKRLCVEPKFAEQLNAYAEALQATVF